MVPVSGQPFPKSGDRYEKKQTSTVKEHACHFIKLESTGLTHTFAKRPSILNLPDEAILALNSPKDYSTHQIDSVLWEYNDTDQPIAIGVLKQVIPNHICSRS